MTSTGNIAVPDPLRWPDVAAVPHSPFRAAVAARLLRRLAERVPIRLVGGGDAAGPPGAPELRLHRPAAVYHRLGARGLIGFGEGYQAGDWDTDDLAGLLTAIAAALRDARLGALRHLRRLRHLPLTRALFRARLPRAEENTVDGARRNIHHHYDLSNDMFALFLDESMTYSSALFPADRPVRPTADGGVAVALTPGELAVAPAPGDLAVAAAPGDLALTAAPGELAVTAASGDLAVAQRNKIDRLLDHSGVGPGSRVLEIGTGWGELAIRAARRGAAVHTVTISVEQRDLAARRVAEAGVNDRVTIELRDYRHIEPADPDGYDAIVSVEMIEAVGERYWPAYFSTLDRLLAPGGRVGLQAILVPHDRLRAARRTYTWIQKYIFPGGVILSTEAIEQLVAGHTRLRVRDSHVFGTHYAATLRLWRERFTANAAAVAALGFDQTFRRTWEYYLASCEAGFTTGHLDVGQFILEPRP
ncbi:SAM-dependent methyltransferase [Phytohabitans aurantiacus]|jgi:cyclopropane-fatty-acyl-phospholipid synthase|nr:cyclopropane-fatty-acyl-phospholipid synthase family protein [Phytohabitans aurantiacus]